MESQDTNFNYKITSTTLVEVIIVILITFYYSYAQPKTDLKYLEDQNTLLVKDITLLKLKIDRLSGLKELNDIELQPSSTPQEQPLDSVARLNFNLAKLTESQKALRVLEIRFDGLKGKSNVLHNNNSLLAAEYEKAEREIQELRKKTTSLEQVEALILKKNKALTKELKSKRYLQIDNVEGAGFYLRAEELTNTTKAATIEKLRGCFTILGNLNEGENSKIIYLQFLDPDMQVIKDNTSTFFARGNTYSKGVELMYLGKKIEVCDTIAVPKGALEEGIYTLNIFEDERLLFSTEFRLK